jgi:hypothetical protein
MTVKELRTFLDKYKDDDEVYVSPNGFSDCHDAAVEDWIGYPMITSKDDVEYDDIVEMARTYLDNHTDIEDCILLEIIERYDQKADEILERIRMQEFSEVCLLQKLFKKLDATDVYNKAKVKKRLMESVMKTLGEDAFWKD